MLNVNDSSWVAHRMHEAIGIIENELIRPSVLLKPKLYPDGNMWCALLGENIQEGVCGFGETPSEAMLKFDADYHSRRIG